MTTLGWRLAGFVIGALLAGCSAQRPVLYPNEHYNSVSPAVVEQDMSECKARAEEFVKAGSPEEQKAKKAAKQAAYGGASGAAIGAVAGAVGGGGAGTGAAVGAATGATAGLFHAIFGGFFGPEGPDPTYANFVAMCLGEKGYQVIGWQ